MLEFRAVSAVAAYCLGVAVLDELRIVRVRTSDAVGVPDWTPGLAAEVGVSLSVLAERFTRYLSDPPMAYLTGWRLRLAAQALTSSPKAIADIAAAVGYESEAAFNRAFKRAFGVPPARYRRQSRAAAGSPRAPALPA